MPLFHEVQAPTREEEAARTHKQSNFLVTVNTQRSGPKYERILYGLRNKFIEEFRYLGKFVEIRREGEWGPCTPEEWRDEKLFLLCEVAYRVEVGGKYGKVHAHIVVKIAHNSFIRMGYEAVHDFFLTEMNKEDYGPHGSLDKLHVNFSTFQAEDVITRYVNKGLINRLNKISIYD